MNIYLPYIIMGAVIALFWLAERRNPDAVTRFEENVLAVLLALITIVSFTQVVARYGFNTGWTGALEFTRILFAWMILFGMSYGLKQGMHLGVDALLRLFPKPVFRFFAIFGAAVRLSLCRHSDRVGMAGSVRRRYERRRDGLLGEDSSRSASASMICAIRNGCRRHSA
jgi:hypothetical protein